MTRIEVKNVAKSFVLSDHVGRPVGLLEALRTKREVIGRRKIDALKGVSFTIGEGERIGIIGRNGAGKSTLLAILAGISTPTSGTVSVVGRVHAMLTIGMVLKEEATGRENIKLDITMHNAAPGDLERRVHEIIAFSELEEFIDQPVRTYSSGMKARLAFSMEAFVDSEILIVDETLAVGDAFFVVKAERRIKELAAKGKIVVIVSHSLGSIEEMCSRCIWLEDGQIRRDGLPTAITEEYLRSIERNDGSNFDAKFAAIDGLGEGRSRDSLTSLRLLQNGREIDNSLSAFQPVRLLLKGRLPEAFDEPCVDMVLTSVDGRTLMRRRIADAASLPSAGDISAAIDLDPFILGVGLYRLELALRDRRGLIGSLKRVFEVFDDEGQYGGQPLLYLPPIIESRSCP
jgi:lipopolysaccharide transport system ATP-binding protein